MKKRAISISLLPIKWKLTLWSTILLFLILVAYNAIQYIVVEKWMVKQEEISGQQTMSQVLNYFLEREVAFDGSEYTHIRGFLERINQEHQLIRVLDDKGDPLIVVSEDIPDDWLDSIPKTGFGDAGTQYVDDNMLITRSPITIFHFRGTVEIVKNMEEFEKLTGAILQVMAFCSMGAIVISGLGGRLLARQLLLPLQSMNVTMKNIKQEGLHERVQFHDNQDEIATLMKMFNEMMDQVERSFQQQRQFVEDASHELRTPLAIIEGHLSLLQRWGKRDPAVMEESLQASIQELSRLKGLVQELLALTRAEKLQVGGDCELQDPDRAVRQMIRNFSMLYPSFQFEVELEPLSGIALAVSEEHLEQILLILLDNAVKYSGTSKRIRIRGAVQQEAASIEIIDNGIGIPEGDLPYVMDRLYRVDKARSGQQGGHGLGLAIAKRLMERYNGAIVIRSVEMEGTTVVISFPL